jgi:thymidylate synthase (FAD)
LVASCASDLDVVNAARVSFNVQHEEMEKGDDKLIAYLLREKHGTPFEHTYLRFRVKAPLFVFREWHRHRVGHSYNEVSMRYTRIDPEFYEPERIRTRIGKPGAYEHSDLDVANAVRFRMDVKATTAKAKVNYLHALESGVAPEMARMLLPVNTYSEMIWSCNARSLMHFCSLRNAPNAQFEIREFAKVAENFLEGCMPITHKAFITNDRQAP